MHDNPKNPLPAVWESLKPPDWAVCRSLEQQGPIVGLVIASDSAEEPKQDQALTAAGRVRNADSSRTTPVYKLKAGRQRRREEEPRRREAAEANAEQPQPKNLVAAPTCLIFLCVLPLICRRIQPAASDAVYFVHG